MGVAMSITAFPVLARILVERRMLSVRSAALAMAGAAVDDVTAWGLLALATARRRRRGSGYVALVIVGAPALVRGRHGTLVGRPLLARVVRPRTTRPGASRRSGSAIIFVGVLAGRVRRELDRRRARSSAPFVMGLVMPRRADLTEDVTRRLEDFVVIVLLPLFFVVTGLKTRDRPARPPGAVG